MNWQNAFILFSAIREAHMFWLVQGSIYAPVPYYHCNAAVRRDMFS